jgi:hypothetical protein
MYLVYAYQNFSNGHLETNGCTRSKEIIHNNFNIVDWHGEADSRKNECAELTKLQLVIIRKVLE